MSDFVMDILYSVFQEELDKFRADGLSDSEIVDKISELKIENAFGKVTEAMSSDAVDTTKNAMYERVMEEQSKVERFMEHNREIWGNGFVASETTAKKLLKRTMMHHLRMMDALAGQELLPVLPGGRSLKKYPLKRLKSNAA